MSRLLFLVVFAFSCAPAVAADDEPLHRRIDALLTASEFGPVAARCGDDAFLRRASLALAGRIPTRDELVAFLNDVATDKRQRCIDRLLQSDDFPRHMAVTFELMLMERRSGNHVKTADFRSFLETAIRDGKSWLEIACEVLAADGTDSDSRTAAGFLLQRNVEPHVLTRDTGRIFFGMDLQCAQCHDHPLVDDYRQDDYYGLNAFFVRSAIFQPDKKKPAAISETAAGEATFKSVFTDREGDMRPRIPGGHELTVAPRQPHERYRVFPAKNTRGVPIDSRLSRLAETLRTTPSQPFDRNIVNRLWAHMFGRGLVHPVDLHHSSNPPTHPEVPELLATEFRRQNHDVAWLLRQIALTDTWQRGFRLPTGTVTQSAPPSVPTTKTAATDDRFQQASELDARYEKLLEQVDKTVAESRPVFAAETAAVKSVEDALKPRDAAKVKFEAAEAAAQNARQTIAALQESAARVMTTADVLQDESLRGAAATLRKITQKQQTGLPKLQSVASAQQQQLTAAQAKLDEAVTKAAPAVNATIPIDQRIRELRRQAYEQRQRAQRLRTTAEAEAATTARLSMAAELQSQQQAIRSLTSRITTLARTADRLQQQLDAARQQQHTTTSQEQARQEEWTHRKERAERHQQLATALKTQSAVVEQALVSVRQLSTALPDLDTAAVRHSLKECSAATHRHSQQQERLLQQLHAQMDATSAAAKIAKGQREQADNRTAELQKQQQQSQQALTTQREQLATAEQQAARLEVTLNDTALNRFAAARLTALTPEQLVWSLLTATGQLERQTAAAAAKLNKDQPLSEAQQQDAQVVQQRQAAIETATRQALAGTVARFAGLYGAVPGQPQDQFFATVDQSLFLANGGEIRGWLAPAKGNLTDRVNRMQSPEAAARELYLCILSRPPTADETADVVEYLQQHGEKRSNAVQEIAWGLITSAEFRFQH